MAGNSVLLYRTEDMYKHVITWWVLCALDPECIASGTKHYCLPSLFTKLQPKCQGFDQSALNLLISNYAGFNEKEYSYLAHNIFKVERNSPISANQDLHLCTRHARIVIKWEELHFDLEMTPPEKLKS